MSIKLPLSQLSFLTKLKPVWRYRVIIFIVFVAGLSSYLLFQINGAVNIAASQEEAQSASAKVPRIDPALVQKLQSLQDNSVTVKSLFNEARENPFQ